MASGDGRRALRIQPNSNIKPHVKNRLRGTRQKLRTKSEPTTVEQVQQYVEEFSKFDGTAENSTAFIELLGLVENTPKDLLSNDDLFDGVFEKTPSLLCSDDNRIRTALFRLLRLLLVNEKRLALYLNLLVDLFAIRSLDVLILPKAERLEALRLLAQLLSIHLQSKSQTTYSTTSKFPASSLKSIHAVAVHRLVVPELGEAEPKLDELNMSALSILLETSVLDPMLVIESCSTDWIPRVLVSPGINNFQICALVCRVLSAWLDDPKIREKAELQLVLEQIFSPLLDLGFFNQADSKLKMHVKVTHTLECCANIFLNLMCTFPGFYACASTEPLIGSIASPLKFLSYLGQVKSAGSNLDKIREIVIDVCCDFVCMPYSGKNFVTWPDALVFYSKLHQPDLYEASLRDNFIVGELQSAMALGIDDTEYVDLLLSFRALATFVLINFGLVQSLIRLILTAPNEPMALKATLLLGDLLRTSISFVPKDWKQLLLSTPALIQLMAQSLLGTVAGKLENRNSTESEQSLPNSENAILLLHRLEELSNVSKTRPNFLSQLKNANLFVLPQKAGHDRPKGGKFYEDNSDLDGLCSDAITNFLEDKSTKWSSFEFLILHFRNLPSLFHRWQHSDKCHTFFVQVTEYFAPKNQVFLKEAVTHEIVKLGSLAFRLIVRLAESEPYYNEILEKYVTDFCRELPENVLYEGVFSPRNIMHTNCYLYFAIMAVIGSKSYGHWMLEKSGFYQL